MKTTNKDSTSLTEVWEWKEKVYNKYLLKDGNEKYNAIKKDIEIIIKKLGLKTFSGWQNQQTKKD